LEAAKSGLAQMKQKNGARKESGPFSLPGKENKAVCGTIFHKGCVRK